MKNSIFTTLMSCALLLLFSCSNDDEIVKESARVKTTLSFTTVLNDLMQGRDAEKQQLGNIPQCSEEAPAYVDVVVTHQDVPVAGNFQEPLRLKVHQDSQGNYFTGETPELELDESIYSLEYFRVLDENLEVIWIAPREEAGEINFAGMVDSPLPLEIDLRAGTKKYVNVDVICYDNRLVNLYGYLFFDLQTNEAIKFCIFGNYCDENGRHIDAVRYSMSVWNFSGDDAAPKGTILYEGLENAIWISDNFEEGTSETGSEPVCVALPDTAGQDQYYFEITILGGVGASAAPNSLIRRGVITDADVRSLYDGDDNVNYYHFREGNCNLEDSPILFENVSAPTVAGNFLPALQSSFDTRGSYEWIHEYNDEGVLIRSLMYERFPSKLLSEFNYSDHSNEGYPFSIKRITYLPGNITNTNIELSYTNDSINMMLTRDAFGNFISKVFLIDYDAANRVTDIHRYNENDMFMERSVIEYNSEGRAAVYTTYSSQTETNEANIIRLDINTYTSFGEIHTSLQLINGKERELEYFYRDDNTLREVRAISFAEEPHIITINRFDENKVRISSTTIQGDYRTEVVSFFPNFSPRIAHSYYLDVLYRTITYNEDRSSQWKIIEEDESYRIEYKDPAGNIYKTEYYNAAGELISET
jgi:hypothetical protein